MSSSRSTTGKSSAAKRKTTKKTRAPAKAKPAETVKPVAGVVTETTAVVSGAALKKKELLDDVVNRSGVKKKYAKPVVEAMIDLLGEAITEGRELNLQPLGKIKHQRSKDTANARITVAKIRQSKAAGPALDPGDRADADAPKETVADTAE